jgi:hypothetical protein
MKTQGTEGMRNPKRFSAYVGVVAGVLLVPVVAVFALLAAPYIFILHWMRQHGEHTFRLKMKSRGRLMPWADFVRTMHGSAGTCIEERFSPKGPVRFWWTPENVYGESPYAVIDWFTMRKGRQAEPFIRWCRERYTAADAGSAMLVDTGLVSHRDIYALWSECRSESMAARWVEVAPPEIVPHSASAAQQSPGS